MDFIIGLNFEFVMHSNFYPTSLGVGKQISRSQFTITKVRTSGLKTVSRSKFAFWAGQKLGKGIF